MLGSGENPESYKQMRNVATWGWNLCNGLGEVSVWDDWCLSLSVWRAWIWPGMTPEGR